jgi:SAM-dependent methyltransferase
MHKQLIQSFKNTYFFKFFRLFTRPKRILFLLKKAVINIFDSKANKRLYLFLYNQVHDLEESKEIISSQTIKNFSFQWDKYPEGLYLLSDSWFKKRVADILSSQELLLSKEWFEGKKILDAGCGNGRWSYGFSQLKADVVCVDANKSAIDSTKKAISEFNNKQEFIVSKLEDLDQYIEKESFDLGFSWGVLHHCISFNKSLKNVSNAVKKGGFIYLYLYSRETVPLRDDIIWFRERIKYNLLDERKKYDFLLKKANNNKNAIHNYHDFYSPLINRRFEFKEIKKILEDLGYTNIIRVNNCSEIFVRATKGQKDHSQYELPQFQGKYWAFEKRDENTFSI